MENENLQSAQTPSKKKSKKKWIIIAIVLILFIGIIGSGSSEPTVETPTNDSESSQTTTKETETTKAATDNIRAGSTVSNDDIKITYKSCNNDFTDYSPYADVKSGYKVVQAIFDFENISSTDVYLEGFDCYADGVKCESFYYVDDYSDPVLTSISVGRKLTDATVYYEVPVDAEKIELEYSSNIWTDEKYIFIVE